MAQDNLDALTDAVMQAESRGRRFGSDAKKLLESVKGAQGEMQVMPKTQMKPGYGVEPAKDKSGEEIARVGRDYLKAMVGKYGDQVHALAAYNWGPGNTDKWLADGADMSKLPAETRKYIREVQSNLQSRLAQQGPGKPTEPTESEKVMEPALRSGMSAQAPAQPSGNAQTILAQLGPNYQAALALNTIAEQDEKDAEDEGDKLDDWQRDKEMEAEIEGGTAKRALAALEGLSFQSPVAGEQQPVRMAAGGAIQLTPIAALNPAKKAELGAAKSEWDKYNTSATAYNDALTKYKTEKYEPYVKQVEAYNAAITSLPTGPGSFKQISQMQSQGQIPVVPVVPEFTMAAPEQPKVEAAKVQALAKAAAQDRNSRQAALDAAGNPEAYGLTINRIGFNHGGSVHSPVYRAEGSPIGGENADQMTPQEIERMAAAQQPAFGVFPQMRPRRTVQDPEAAKNVPVDVARGVVAGTAGLIPDMLNLKRSLLPKEATDALDERGMLRPKVEYDTEYFLKNLPLKNEAPVSQAAGQLGAMFPVVPVNTISKGVEAVKQLPSKAAEMLNRLKGPKRDQEYIQYLMGGEHNRPINPTDETTAQVYDFMREQQGPGAAPPAAQNMPVVEPVAPPVAQAPARPRPTPTAERPFVGRLDQFVADLPGPMQKQQFINQVKNKFRDYDVARVEEALADLPANAKLTPEQLQESLSQIYSPSRWRTEDLPVKKGFYYQNMDNVFGTPMGTTNLYLDLPPGVEAKGKEIFDFANRLSKVYTSKGTFDDLKKVTDFLDTNPLAKELSGTGELRSKLAKLGSAESGPYVSLQKERAELHNISNALLSPVFYKEKGEALYDSIVTHLAQKYMNEGMKSSPAIAEAQTEATKQIFQKGLEELRKRGLPEPDLNLLNLDKMDKQHAYLHAKNQPGFELSVNKSLSGPMEDVYKAEDRIKKLLQNNVSNVITEAKKIIPYTGQHTTVAGQSHPIGFSRYTEHVADVPGYGELKGRHYHEFQSDLAQDIRKEGPKGSSLEKDKAEYAALSEKANQLRAKDPGSIKNMDQHNLEISKLDHRLFYVGNRMRKADASYHLEQPFSGMETNPYVEQQLLMKNAIQAAMRKGDQFATFPGAESSQAQLYERVPNNLKQVIKDLGGEKSGLEKLSITLKDASGNPIMVQGVTWSPEAAARILENGIPFAKGGMVERNTSDNRRYL